MSDAANNTETKQVQAEVAIQRIYVKDVSLETPNSPGIFLEEWKPEINLDLHTESNKLDDTTYEATLRVTVTAKLGDKTAFLVEVNQAGIFTITGLEEDQMGQIMGAFCPTILYPYAREAISDFVVKAGFPPLYLSHVNFDAMYMEQQNAEQADK